MNEPEISPGLAAEATQKVTPDLTAPHIGSGSLSVYATPAMVAFVERTCASLVADRLGEGQTTVGVELHVRHLAPTPQGADVRIRAVVEEVDTNLITFRAQIWDDVELIGEVVHKRVVIDIERFLRRVRAKNRAEEPDE